MPPSDTRAELKAVTDEFFRAVSFEPGQPPAYPPVPPYGAPQQYGQPTPYGQPQQFGRPGRGSSLGWRIGAAVGAVILIIIVRIAIRAFFHAL